MNNNSIPSTIWKTESVTFENILQSTTQEELDEKNISIANPSKNKDIYVFTCNDALITYKKTDTPFIEYCSLINPKKPETIIKITPNFIQGSCDKNTIRESFETNPLFQTPKGALLLNYFDTILSLDTTRNIKPLEKDDLFIKISKLKIREQEAIIHTLEKNLKKAQNFIKNSIIGKIYLGRDLKNFTPTTPKYDFSTLLIDSSNTKESINKKEIIDKLKQISLSYKITIDELTQKSQKALNFIEDIQNNRFGKLLFKKEIQNLDSEKDNLEK